MKQQVPVAVAETLEKISKEVKRFNETSEIKIVAKTGDNFILKIYPKDIEDLFFVIVNASNNGISDRYLYSIRINRKSFNNIRIISLSREIYRKIFKYSTEIDGDYSGQILSTTLYSIFKDYLATIDKSFNLLATTNVDFSKLFNIEEEDPEIHPSESQISEIEATALPYSLKQLSVKDFQGIKETGIEGIPIDSQWIFLVGENGFGKTTVLQSIFLGLNGPFDGNTPLLEDRKSSIQVEYKNGENENCINSIRDNKSPLVHLAAYGPGRLNLQGVNSENAEARNNSVSYNLFNSDGFLFNINAELVRWGLKKDKRFGLVKRAICTLIPNIADVKLNEQTDQIEYIEQEINIDGAKSSKYQPLTFQKLASGFKSVIALAGDMIIRLSKHQPEIHDPSELKGIVIIDELDLHLHPKLQKQLVGQFSKVFPKVQFIVSTHSPIPLLGAAANSVILKVTRSQSEGIQIEKVNVNLRNLTPNLVLTSGIFDMEDFTSVQNEDISEVRTEDSFAEMEKNDTITRYLDEFEKSNAQFPDELFAPKSKK
ncbi:MAG: AAA family ATPase [Spirosomaceae bacterium]|jgi:predicted ATPase|nr:AAA family ATPase [Spirosomataceae bacterium]